MRRKGIHRKIVLTVLGIATILGGVFFFLHTSSSFKDALFRNNQVLYAEVPTRATQALSVAPLATSTENIKVPILVYHIVRPSYPTDSRAVVALAHTPEVFDAEMQYLAENGYHVIAFHMLEDAIKNGTPLPAQPILITFDDGWSDQFTYAFPILEKYKYTATFFVFTNPIGTRGFMTWDNLRALRDAGMNIGSHSLSHPFLTKITDPAILWNEINGSKKTLEKNLGITVREFAYPFGKYTASTTALVQQAGYTAARGDYVKKDWTESENQLYELGALNAPTTTELFARRFPSKK